MSESTEILEISFFRGYLSNYTVNPVPMPNLCEEFSETKPPFLLDRVPVSDALNAAKSMFELFANLFVSETLYSLNISAIIWC